MFGHLFNNLKEHAELTATGLDSEQASEVVFHKLRLIQTEDARSSVSSCCASEILFDQLGPYCTGCGESCNLVPNASV